MRSCFVYWREILNDVYRWRKTRSACVVRFGAYDYVSSFDYGYVDDDVFHDSYCFGSTLTYADSDLMRSCSIASYCVCLKVGT